MTAGEASPVFQDLGGKYFANLNVFHLELVIERMYFTNQSVKN